MKIKLKKIEPEFKNKYVIIVSCMHGDGDAYTDEEYVCKDEADFIRIMSAPEGPESPGSGGDDDEYNDFYAELFGDSSFIPGDCTCDHEVQACVELMDGLYYDND